MPASTISICNEPDEFEAALQHRGHVGLWVTGPGPFRACLIRFALPHSSLLVTEETSPRIAFISPAPGAVVVIVPLDGESQHIWAGTPLRAGAILTISGGQPVHAHSNGPCRTGIVCFATRDFDRFAEILIGPHFTVAGGVQRWHPDPSALRSLTRLCLAAIHVKSAQPIALSLAYLSRTLCYL